jgi:preprotein translocase subunit SecE
MGFIDYLRETKAELRHVSWPTREQAIQYTTVVIGIAVGTGVFLGMLDYLFSGALHSLILRFS